MTRPRPCTLHQILVETPLYATRLWLSAGALLWAVLLLWPGSLFEGRQTYALMAKVAPENIWGIAFLIQSVWAFYTLRTGTKNHVSLAMDAMLGCVLWSATTLLCFAAHWPNNPANFCGQLAGYAPPAAMSAGVIMSFASWWHLVRYWAEENTESCEDYCNPNRRYSLSGQDFEEI